MMHISTREQYCGNSSFQAPDRGATAPSFTCTRSTSDEDPMPTAPLICTDDEQVNTALWPLNSNHVKDWLFSAEAVAEYRGNIHEEALGKIKGLRPTIVEFPTVRDLAVLQQYFALQLITIFQKKGLRLYVLEAACLFFHRFFLYHSPLYFDVRVVLFSCIMLALKAHDLARHYTIGELFGDIEDLDIGAVIALELPVCEGLRFQLLTLHTRDPLDELIQMILDKLEDDGVLHNVQSAPDPDQDNVDEGISNGRQRRVRGGTTTADQSQILQLFVSMQERAEADCLLMHASTLVPLMHPPGLLAVAALLCSHIRKELLLLNVDIEAIIRNHVIQTVGSMCATNSAANVKEPLQNRGVAYWSKVQSQVSVISEELRAVHNMQKQLHSPVLAEQMSNLLERCIEATEILQKPANGKSATNDPDSSATRREKKKKRKEKKHRKIKARPDALL